MRYFKKKTIKEKPSWDKVLGMALVIIFAAMCIMPLWSIVAISFTEEQAISLEGYSLFPSKISLEAYNWVIKTSGWQISKAYGVTAFVTVCGTFLSLLVISLMAYAIARPDFKWKTPLAFIAYFTMLFNGGLIPTYMVITRLLNLKDNIFVLILPYAVNAWNLLLMRTFFRNIPNEIFESAYIDGASNLRIYYRIVLPLSKPAFAAIGILIALKYWNDWWLPLLYINDNSLSNLQFVLYRVMANLQAFQEMAQLGVTRNVDFTKIPGETMRMAICIIVAGPMLVIFPFFQKHFARGLTAGSIKG